MLGKVYEGKEEVSRDFIVDYLKQDGVFVLRLVNLNVSGLVCAQLAGALWDQFKAESSGPGFHRTGSKEEAEIEFAEL